MILVLDDEDYLKKIVEKAFPAQRIEQFTDSWHFLKAVKTQHPDLLVLDLRVEKDSTKPPEWYFSRNPALEGVLVLEKIRQENIDIPAVIATRFAVSEVFMRAYALNAFPLEVTETESAVQSLREKVGHFLEKQSTRELLEYYRQLGVVVGDPKSISLLKAVEKIKDTDDVILLTGESGVGKDTLARAIHFGSRRKAEPYLNFVISAYPKNLLFAKLFGTVKKSYTDAGDRMGSFEAVEKGTLVLNEIGELDLDSQIHLLQVIEESAFSRLGENKKRFFRGRLIALTNVNLVQKVKEGKFREDLYNRLRKFYLDIPPLRERRGDILPFIETFYPSLHFSQAAKQFLVEEFTYPGNVRTLKFILDRIKLFCSHPASVSLDDVISAILDLGKGNHVLKIANHNSQEMDFLEYLLQNNLTIDDLIAIIWRQGMKRFGKTWSPEGWGRLGISKPTFYRKLKQMFDKPSAEPGQRSKDN